MKKILTTILLLFAIALFQDALAKNSKEMDVAPQVQYLNLSFWETFDDPQLRIYFTKLFENNQDLKIAHLKIKEGEQVIRQNLANELPQIQLSGNVQRIMRSSDEYFGADMEIPNFSQTNLLFPLNANYELDIWGMNRDITKASKQKLEITKQQERAQYISITGNFAATYYNIVKCDKLIHIQKELIVLQKKALSLSQKKFDLGQGRADEVINEQKTLKYFEEELDILVKERAILENEMKTVLADNEIQEIKDASSVQIPIFTPPAKISSELIETRPDYIMYENNLKRMGYDVRIAKKNFLPRFIIFGKVGLNAYSLSNLFNSTSLLSSVGVAPVLDLFSGGRKVAYLRFKKYEYEEALQQYQKVILTSAQEINNALVEAKTSSLNYDSAKERLTLEGKNHVISQKRYDSGVGTMPEVIKSQEIYLICEKDKINYQANSLISFIGLYKSLGGKNPNELEAENI